MTYISPEEFNALAETQKQELQKTYMVLGARSHRAIGTLLELLSNLLDGSPEQIRIDEDSNIPGYDAFRTEILEQLFLELSEHPLSGMKDGNGTGFGSISLSHALCHLQIVVDDVFCMNVSEMMVCTVMEMGYGEDRIMKYASKKAYDDLMETLTGRKREECDCEDCRKEN